jgi:hypothetical protein
MVEQLVFTVVGSPATLDRAQILLFSVVSSLMVVSVPDGCKGLLAMQALVRALPCVMTVMDLLNISELKCLPVNSRAH